MAEGMLKAALEMLIASEQGSNKYEMAAFTVWHKMTGGHRETLKGLVIAGPVYDGDIVSKSCRDDLIEWGLASRACVKREQGYTIANYVGWDVFQIGVTP